MQKTSILPKKTEPTMQRKFSDINENTMSSQSVSMSESLSEVCQVLSQCRVTIASSDEDPAQHLPHVELILSEMNQLVQTISDKQQQQPSHDDEQELCWDYYNTTMLSDYSTPSSCTSSDLSSDVLEDNNVGDLFVQEDSFIVKMTKAIERYAPNSTFNRAKHERRMTRKMMRMIPKELHCLWRNVDSVTGATPAVSPVKPAPALKVNWSQVNTRALANVPKPKLYPKHGCSEDPSHYLPYTTTSHWGHDGTPRTINHKSKFEEENPFGSAYGVETDAGVLNVSGILIHGHTWSEERGCWVLHASLEPDDRGGNRQRGRGRDDRRSRDRRDRDRRTGG